MSAVLVDATDSDTDWDAQLEGMASLFNLQPALWDGIDVSSNEVRDAAVLTESGRIGGALVVDSNGVALIIVRSDLRRRGVAASLLATLTPRVHIPVRMQAFTAAGTAAVSRFIRANKDQPWATRWTCEDMGVHRTGCDHSTANQDADINSRKNGSDPRRSDG